MAFRGFSVRVSWPQPSILHRESQHLFCRFTSSRLNHRESTSGFRFSQMEREFKDCLAKLNDKSKEVKHQMLHLRNGLAEDSAEFKYLFKTLVKSKKTWLRQHVPYYVDCMSKVKDESWKLKRRMRNTELGIAKECADYEKLRDDYILSVIRLIKLGSGYVAVFGLFYKAGRLQKPADR